MSRPSGSRRTTRTLALAAALAGIALCLAPSTAAAPRADRPPIGEGALSIRIDDLAPSIPDQSDVLVVRGAITNTSQATVASVSAALRVSPTTLVGRADIPRVVAGEGTRMGVQVPGTLVEVAGQLAAGQSVDFELRADVADLGLGVAGVYVTGAEALGDSGGGVVRQDLDRTFLPWWPEGTTGQPLLVTMLWPLSGRPERDARGILPNEDLAVDMSPAGRLSILVDGARRRAGAVSPVLDPEVLEAAGAMSQGYQVRGPGDTLVDGTRASEVTQWLTQVTTVLTDEQTTAAAALYALTDVVAARRGNVLSRVLGQRQSVDAGTAALLGQPLPSSVVLVPGGNADDATLAALAARDVGPVVMDDWAMAPSGSPFFTPSGSATWSSGTDVLTLLLLDSGLSDALAMPASSAADVTAMRQRLLAETLVTERELPATQRMLVASPEPDWSPSASAARAVVDVLGSTPWIEPFPIEAAVAREVSSVPRTHTPYGPGQDEQALPDSHVAAVRAQYQGLARYSEVVSDPADIEAAATTAPTRQLGTWFRSRPDQRAQLQLAVSGQVRQALGSVGVVSSGSVTVSGTSGTIPVTVENSGTVPVTVGLQFTSSPPLLFTADPIQPFEIAPQRRTSVEVSAEVTGAGRIPVTIRLLTADGQPFGEPAQLVVRSSAYANAARVLVRVSLALLVTAVAVHGVRRARRARARRASAEDDDAASPGTTDVLEPERG